MYKVIKKFHDLQDEMKTKSGTVYFEYNVGDVFPRKGKDVSEDRLAELAGDSNGQGVPLIALVEEAGEPGTVSDNAPASPSKEKAGKKIVK